MCKVLCTVSTVTKRIIWHKLFGRFFTFRKISTANLRILWRHLPTECLVRCKLHLVLYLMLTLTNSTPNPNPNANPNPTRCSATVFPHLYSAFYPSAIIRIPHFTRVLELSSDFPFSSIPKNCL